MNKYENAAAILSLIPSLLTDLDAISFTVYSSADSCEAFRIGQVHLKTLDDMDKIPGEIVITERKVSKYPFEISKTYLGVKFYVVTDSIPNNLKVIKD